MMFFIFRSWYFGIDGCARSLSRPTRAKIRQNFHSRKSNGGTTRGTAAGFIQKIADKMAFVHHPSNSRLQRFATCAGAHCHPTHPRRHLSHSPSSSKPLSAVIQAILRRHLGHSVSSFKPFSTTITALLLLMGAATTASHGLVLFTHTLS